MKQVERTKRERRKRRGIVVLITVLALLAFTAGVSIPLLMKSSSGGSEMTKLQTILNLLENDWYFAREYNENPDHKEDLSTRLVEQAIGGMTYLEEDPHTNYFNLEQAKAFSQTLSGSNVGIGISFVANPDGGMQVKRVFTNSTADQAGLQKGDIIVKVGDYDAKTTPTENIIAFIKEQKGQEIPLEVQRGSQKMTVHVTPGSYDSTVSDLIESDYGEIILNSFSENSGSEFKEAVGRMQSAGIKNLILDLRNNTGGYVSAAQEIASSLLPEDSVVFLEDNGDGKNVEYKTKKGFEQVPFEHIYVLQNENTASASEVLIGALKDNLPEGTVITIGTTSYGKGTEQRSIPFEDGTSIKYTVARWLTPNGTSINNTGFTPDIPIEALPIHTVGYREMTEEEIIEPDTVHDNAGAVQVFLQFLDYPAQRTDNYFSPASSEVLRAFQKDHNLPETGNVDKKTFDELLNEISLKLSLDEDELDQARNAAIAEIKGSKS